MSGNLTRINNNQITDASSGNAQLGINANTKVQPYSITSALLANNFTYGNNFTITGNLTVNGNSTSIDTTNTTIEDPLLILASNNPGHTVDIGYIGLRDAGANNISFVWKESLNSFVTVFTDSTIGDTTTINITSYADFITGNANITGTLTAANVSFTGNVASLTVTGNITGGNVLSNGVVSATGTITGGNVSTAGFVTATGNIYGDNIFSNTSISATSTVTGGNLVTGGFVSSTGNITGGNIETAGTITATNTITGGNVSTAGNVSANIISATGTITGGNISTAGFVTATGNVSGNNVNVTTDLSVGGNIAAGNIATTGQISSTGNITVAANAFFIGDGSLLSNLSAGSQIANGTSNVSIATANGNITMGVAGTADVVIVSTNGIDTTGVVSAAGNVYGNNISATGTMVAAGNITGGNVLTGGLVSATANVTGGNVLTGGLVSATANVTGGNLLTGGLVSATATITGGNVETAGFVTATGNIHGGNVLTGGLLSVTGNIDSAANINGNNINATNTLTATNASVTGNIIVDADISAGNVITSSITTAANSSLTIYGNTGITFSSVGNISAGNLYINDLSNPVNAQDAATKDYVDSVAQGIVVHPTSNVATTTELQSLTNFDTIAYDNGTDGVGATLTIGSTAQLSIDGVNLSTLVAGSGRVLVKNENVTATATTDAAWNGIYVVTSSNTTETVLTRADDFDGSPGGEIPSAYTFVTQGTVNTNSGWVCTNTAAPTIGTTDILFTQFSQAGNYTAGNGLTLTGAQFSVNTDNVTTTITSGNVVVKASANLVTPNIGNATFESLSAVGGTGNILANNISITGTTTTVDVVATGYVSATGYVLGSNVFVTSLGNTTVPYANASGGLLSDANFTYTTGLLSVGNVATTGNVSAAGNVVAANFVTSGSTGNITGANIVSATTFTATGNIYADGNVIVGANVSVSGNVTANYFIGDGSQLANLSAGSQLINGNSNVTVAANSNVSFTVNSVANVVVISDTGITTTGYVTATGNVSANTLFSSVLTSTRVPYVGASNQLTDSTNLTWDNANQVLVVGAGGAEIGGDTGFGYVYAPALKGTTLSLSGNVVSPLNVPGNTISGGNVTTDGLISATANITGGNVLTAGFISATANITGGNVLTAGFITATGNATAGNILTAGQVSATGDVFGNVITGTTANITNSALVGSLSVTGNVDGGNVFFVDTSTNTASFGSSTQTTNAIVAFNATNSILLPVGNTAQRPGTGVEGMVRWSTTSSAMEAYDGTQWTVVGAPSFTVIQNEQFNGDGTTVTFTLGSTQTTDSCIVTINGVVQIPTTAYAVTGTSLVFTEAPAVGDTIDVREITTTTTVTGLTASNISLVGNIVATLGNTPTTALVNSSLTFSLASDTSLIVSVKGGDGTVRSATITLAP